MAQTGFTSQPVGTQPGTLFATGGFTGNRPGLFTTTIGGPTTPGFPTAGLLGTAQPPQVGSIFTTPQTTRPQAVPGVIQPNLFSQIVTTSQIPAFSLPQSQVPMSELDQSKKQILNQKRIKSQLELWTDITESQLLRYKRLGENTLSYETNSYQMQSEIMHLQNANNKIQKTQERVNDQIEMFLTEQGDLNRGLDVLERELDRVLDSSRSLARMNVDSIYDEVSTMHKRLATAEQSLHDSVSGYNKLQLSDPVHDIESTLDSFLDSLIWVESQVASLSAKVSSLQLLNT